MVQLQLKVNLHQFVQYKDEGFISVSEMCRWFKGIKWMTASEKDNKSL